MSQKREIFLLAGEASGNLRGAELIRALREEDSSLCFSGMGGPAMGKEGMEILADVSNLAVVGILEVLKHYKLFKATMDRLLIEIEQRKPVAVIGIDYPGFNLRLLKKVSQLKNPPKRIQYISPQLWAWNENRKWQMASYLDLVLCIFPFEPAIYKGTGLKAVFVGHPLIQIPCRTQENRTAHLVAFFPGSRSKEIQAHMPVFVELEKKCHFPLQIAYAASSSHAAEMIRAFSPECRIETSQFLLESAAVGVVCSGTATLEAALAGLPMCVVYRVSWPTYWMGRCLIKVPFLAMPNLLLGRLLVKEFIQSGFTVEMVEKEIRLLLENPRNLADGYRAIRQVLGEGQAAKNAAKEIGMCINFREIKM